MVTASGWRKVPAERMHFAGQAKPGVANFAPMEQRRRHRRSHRRRRITPLRIAKVSAVIVLSIFVSVVMYYSGRYRILDLGTSEPQE
jgi:hypothetical protein